MRDNSAGDRARREREHFDRLSEEQGEIWWGHMAPAGQRRSERRAELVMQYANVRPNQHVLEVGCGSGFFTKDYVGKIPPAARLTAMDISPAAVEAARRKPEFATRPNVTFDVQDVEALSYPDETFDAMIGSSVLHHFRLDRALPELWRVLKPGGAFVFAEPNFWNPILFLGHEFGIGHALKQASPDERPLYRVRVAAQLAEHGFRVETVRPFDFLHPSTPRPLQGILNLLGRTAEALPAIHALAGSLLIAAHKRAR